MTGAVNPNRPERGSYSWDKDQPVLEYLVKNGHPVKEISVVLKRTEGAVTERGRRTLGTVYRNGFLVKPSEKPKKEKPVTPVEQIIILEPPGNGGDLGKPALIKPNGGGNGSSLKDQETLLTEILNELRVNGRIMEEGNSATRKLITLLEKREQDKQLPLFTARAASENGF